MKPAPVICMNAFPGVGKFAIARALQPLLPGSRILHNHELIYPVERSVPSTSPRYAAARAEYRRARLKPIHQDPQLRDAIFIFTNSQMDYNECVSDYTDLCLSTTDGGVGRRLYSVILECDEEENCRCLALAGRGKEGGNGKLTDVGMLMECRSRGGVHKFEDSDEIALDVTTMAPEEAARRVKEFVERREEEGRSGDELEF